ncbi:MAG: LytTR family DNA-binding domain-containing protein [Muribaculaceae bacterium]|nr:LytTR family DNA-binding domain-containing protein [Muribaculaceae bacterium]
MQLRTLIIDDEPIALAKLRKYVEKVPFLELTDACSDGIEAMARLAAGDVDLVITDINMPDVNGLELIGSLAHKPMVIFTTAHPHYALESYRVSAVDYLLKPYSFADFQRAVNKAHEQFMLRRARVQPEAEPTALFVKTDHRFVRVDPGTISHIKSYGEYLQIYLSTASEPLLTLSSFGNIARRLPSNFMQVHRSYVVNMDRVAEVSRSRIVMEGGAEIPVGDTFKDAVLGYVSDNSLGNPRRRDG